MNPNYEPFLKQIDNNLKFKIHDCTDDHNARTSRALEQDIRNLISDLRTNKNPRDIEGVIKTIQNRLREAHGNPGSYMSVEHADEFHQIFEQMRMNLRRLPNY